MFVDDCWLLLVFTPHGSTTSPRFVLLNMEQASTDDPQLTQTTFRFGPCEYSTVETVYGQGGHEASPEDSLAPFYQDPFQRVLTIRLHGAHHIPDFVVKVEVLLKLARERGGADVEWEQWKTYVVKVNFMAESDLWASGSRFFSMELDIDSDHVSWVDVFGFSPRASAQYVDTVSYVTQGTVWRVLDQNDMDSLKLPWDIEEIRFSNCGHDSLVFLVVRISRSMNYAKT